METAKIVLMILGGLGALLVGMELLQQATEKVATTGLKKLFSKTSKNPMVGLGIGTLATMIMQSSGATTVMVVGFVNAGVMSLAQATAYIMGANIGTTITAQIVALGDLPITPIIISLTLIGILVKMLLGKRFPKIADIAMLVVGLGVLFLGLEVMKDNMTLLLTDQVTNFLKTITNPFLLLFIGILTTVAFQSSSAITSIIIAMTMAAGVGNPIFVGNAVLYIILGTNIGSTSTAMLSAIGSTTNGKRAAMIHLLFNLFGSIIFFIILVCVPNFYDITFNKWFASSPQTAIAMFHTFFNVVCTILFMPFIKWFVKLSSLLIPEKKGKKEKGDDVLDERFLNNAAIAFSQAVTYYHSIAKIALNDLNMAIDAFLNKDNTKKDEIDNIEKDVLKMTKSLTEFIVKIQAIGISEESNSRLSKMLLDVADIVRLTEVADNITGYTNHEVTESLVFSDVVYLQIKEMKELLNQQFQYTEQIVETPDVTLLEQARMIEDKIDDLRTTMVRNHMDRLAKGECAPQNSNIFVNLVGNLERCGDHFNFICERACSTISEATSTHA